MSSSVALGDRIREPITGFVGLVISRCEYLYASVRVGVQPLALKEGKLQDEVWMDESRLDVIKTEDNV